MKYPFPLFVLLLGGLVFANAERSDSLFLSVRSPDIELLTNTDSTQEDTLISNYQAGDAGSTSDASTAILTASLEKQASDIALIQNRLRSNFLLTMFTLGIVVLLLFLGFVLFLSRIRKGIDRRIEETLDRTLKNREEEIHRRIMKELEQKEQTGRPKQGPSPIANPTQGIRKPNPPEPKPQAEPTGQPGFTPRQADDPANSNPNPAPARPSIPSVPPPSGSVIRTEYAGAPRNDVFYGNHISSKLIPSETVYQIDVHQDNRADLRLVNHPETLMRAFQYPGSFLTACRLLKSGELRNPGSIQSTPGILRKEGNNWILEEKITVTDWS